VKTPVQPNIAVKAIASNPAAFMTPRPKRVPATAR